MNSACRCELDVIRIQTRQDHDLFSQGTAVKIATYNMQHQKRGKTNWTKVFDDIAPDILLSAE